MSLEGKIAFVGAGNMASAIIGGLLSSGVAGGDQIVTVDPSAAARERIRELHGEDIEATDDPTALAGAAYVVLAIKPQIVSSVLPTLAKHMDAEACLISIVAGVPAATLEAGLRTGVRVIRTMPNTPSLVGAGATAIAAGMAATEDDLAAAETLFDAVGICVRVPEKLLDAVTGLSGSGPAYGYLFIEALADGGVREGLPRDIALRLAAQTVLGAGKMVLESGLHPGVLKDQVTSPGGTTIEAVHSLERAGFRGAAMSAVIAGAGRSRALRGD